MYARRGCCCGKSIYPWCFYRGSCDNMYDVYLLPESIARTIQEEPGDPRDKLDFLYGGTDHSKVIKFRWSANPTFNAKISDNLLNGSVVHQPAVEYTLYSYHEDVGNRPEVTQECTQLCEDAGRVPPIIGGGPDFLIYDTCYESFLKTYDDSMANGRSVGDVLGEHSYIRNVSDWSERNYLTPGTRSQKRVAKHTIENIFRGLTTEYPAGYQFDGERGNRPAPITAGTFDTRWEKQTSFIPESTQHTKEKGAWDVEMDPIFCMYGEDSIYREKIAYFETPRGDLPQEEYEAVIRGITTETNDWIDADEVYRNVPATRSANYPNSRDEPGYLKYTYFNGGYRSKNFSNEFFRTQGADVEGVCAGDGTIPVGYNISPEKGGDVSPLYGIYYGQNQTVGAWHSWLGGLEYLAADAEVFNPDIVTWDYKFPQYQVAKYTTPGSACLCESSSPSCTPVREFIETGFCTAQNRISTYSYEFGGPVPDDEWPAGPQQPVYGHPFERVAFDKEFWPGYVVGNGTNIRTNTPNRNSYFKDLRNGIGTITNADSMPAIPSTSQGPFFDVNSRVIDNGTFAYSGLEAPAEPVYGGFDAPGAGNDTITSYVYTLEQKQRTYRYVDTITDDGEFITVLDTGIEFQGNWSRQQGGSGLYFYSNVHYNIDTDGIPPSIPNTQPGKIQYDITEAGASISCGPIFNEGNNSRTLGGRPLFGPYEFNSGYNNGGIQGSGQDLDEYPYWRIIDGVSNVYTLDELGIDNPQYEVLLKDSYTSVNWVPGMTYGAKVIVDTDITIGPGMPRKVPGEDGIYSAFYMDQLIIPEGKEDKSLWSMDNTDIFSPGMWNGLYCGIGIKGHLKPAASLLSQGKIQNFNGGAACTCPGQVVCCPCDGFESGGCSVYNVGGQECTPRICNHNPDKQIAVLPRLWIPTSILENWNWVQNVSYQIGDGDDFSQIDKTQRRTTTVLDTRTVGGNEYAMVETKFATSTTVTTSESGDIGNPSIDCYQWSGPNGEAYETCYTVWEDGEPPNVETNTCTQSGSTIIGGFSILPTYMGIHEWITDLAANSGPGQLHEHPYRKITIPLRWMDLGFHETPFKDTANLYISDKEEQKCMESRAYAEQNKETAEGIQDNKIFEYAGVTGASCGVVCPENIKFYDFPYKGNVGLYGTKKYEFKPEYQNYLDWLITNEDIKDTFKEWAAATVARQRTVSKLFYWPKDFADRISTSPASHIFGLNTGMTEWRNGWSEGDQVRGFREPGAEVDDEYEPINSFFFQHARGATIDVPLIGSVSNMYITWEEKPQIVQACELQDNSGLGSEAGDSLVPLFVRRERTSGNTSGLPYPNVIGNLPSGVASDDQVYRNFILGRKTEFTDPNEYVPYPEEGFSDVYRNEYHGLWANWGYAGKIKDDPREYRFDRNYPKDLRRIPRFDQYGEMELNMRNRDSAIGFDEYRYRNYSQLPELSEREKILNKNVNKWCALFYDEGALADDITWTYPEDACPSGATLGFEQYERAFNNGVAYHWALARMSNRNDVPMGRNWQKSKIFSRGCPEDIRNIRQFIYQNTFYGQPESVRGWTASDYPWLTGFTMGIDPDINWCSTTPKADPDFYEE